MSVPRLVPDISFPPYSFVPGLFPHPISDPEGHSHGIREQAAAPVGPDDWHTNRDYLFGIDLFNHGYYWEAHEVWEGLWHAAGRAGLDQRSEALQRGFAGIGGDAPHGRMREMHR